MSERLEDRLRRAAQTYRKLGNYTAEGMFIEAAYTITELRGALSVASVDYRHLSDENARLRAMRDTWAENDARLRELVRELYEDQCDECDRWRYRDRLRELEMEVDG